LVALWVYEESRTLDKYKIGVYTPIKKIKRQKALLDTKGMSGKINRLELTDCPNCVCFNLRKAARAITQLYDKILRPTGLRTTQFSLLAATSLLEPVTLTRLAEMGVIDRTTLSRNFKPLEKLGLIKVTSGEDRRTRIVTLTDRGKEALAKALPLWKKAQASVVRELGHKRWEYMQANLQGVVSIADKS
jgi:DNA-binding MarR family transcriptional regulator